MKFLENSDSILKDLEQALFSLHPNAENLYTLIQTIKDLKEHYKANPYVAPFPLEFNINETVANKILFAINKMNKFAKAVDIQNKIKEYEPNFNSGLSTPLTYLRESGAITVIKPNGSNKDSFYGFPMWINDSGNPKLEYLYNIPDIKTLKFLMEMK